MGGSGGGGSGADIGQLARHSCYVSIQPFYNGTTASRRLRRDVSNHRQVCHNCAFLPLAVGAKTAADLALVFAKEICGYTVYHRIQSNRNSRFTLATWQVFLANLVIRPRMSTAFAPRRTDRPSRVFRKHFDVAARSTTHAQRTSLRHFRKRMSRKPLLTPSFEPSSPGDCHSRPVLTTRRDARLRLRRN